MFQTKPRTSGSGALDLMFSPIQKRPRLTPSFTHSLPHSLTTSLPHSLTSYTPPTTLSHHNNSSLVPHSSRYYPPNSRSHLPLTQEMIQILKVNFHCSSPDRGVSERDSEVNLLTFIQNVEKDDCIHIICGENQRSDILNALYRINDVLVDEQACHSGDSGDSEYGSSNVSLCCAWVTWTALIGHLESAVQPSSSSASVLIRKAIQEKQKKSMIDLHALRVKALRDRMQKAWGAQAKSEYEQFLYDNYPQQYPQRQSCQPRRTDTRNDTRKTSGGGGGVFSRPSENPDTVQKEDSNEIGGDDKVNDDGDSRGGHLFNEIQKQLSRLEVGDESVVDRISERMANKGRDDRAAELEIQRKEADCSLEGNKGAGPEAVAALVAMRHTDLTVEEEDVVDKALARPHDNTILIDKFNQDISRLKMSCLRPGTWLNDEIVNFYMNMLQERDKALCALPGTTRKSSHFFNSFFVSKLLEGDTYTYKNVKRWTKKFDIFSKEKVFFPVNISNTHWTMMVAFMQKKKIVYYDSMGGSGHKYTKALLRYLNDDSVDKRKHPIDTEEWTLDATGRNGAPQQENGFDCGMFATMYADFISDDLPFKFKQQDIADYRRKAVAAILRGELNYPVD